VFMLGEQVRVTTRRYDRGEAESFTLAFHGALAPVPSCRPQFPVLRLLTAVLGLKFSSGRIRTLSRDSLFGQRLGFSA
jgi:hypothetical protein